MLGETEKSSDVCRTASLSEMGHEQRAATSSTVTDQRRKNFFVRTINNISIIDSFVSQVKPSNCFRLHPYRSTISKHSTIPVPNSKISFTFHFWHKSFILETCRVIQQQFWMKNVTFLGSKHTVTPPTYFQGSRLITPKMYAPASDIIKSTLLLPLTPQ